jgi:hypothetical protein
MPGFDEDDDPYGFGSTAAPPRAKPKRRRAEAPPQIDPAAPDTEPLPVDAPEGDDDPYGFFTPPPSATPAAMGPPAPMGPPRPPPPRPTQQPTDPLDGLLRDLKGGYLGAMQGASGNALDEAVEYLTPDSIDELLKFAVPGGKRGIADALRTAGEEYPVPRIAGNTALGMAAGLAGGPSVLGQAAVGGALSGASEWFDSHNPWRAAAASGTGAALSGVLSKVGNWGANKLSRTRTGQALHEIEQAGREAGQHAPPAPQVPGPELTPEVVPPRPQGLPDYHNPPPMPDAPEAPIPLGDPKPRSLPPPTPPPAPGPMGPFPEGPPRPNTPDYARQGSYYEPGYGAPEGAPSPPVRGQQSLMLGEPPPPYDPGDIDPTVIESLGKGPDPRTGGPQVDLDELLRPDYRLEGMPEGIEGALSRGPRPRTGGFVDDLAREPGYQVGELENGAREAAKRGFQPNNFDPPPADYELGVLEPVVPRETRPMTAIENAQLSEKLMVERKLAKGAAGIGIGEKITEKLLGVGAWVPGPVGKTLGMARTGLQASQIARSGVPDPAAKLYANEGARALGQQTAYATAPTLNYALQAVLSSGQTKLPKGEQDELTSALVSGDQGAISSAWFRAQQTVPGFAREVQDTLNSLTENK